MTKECGQHPHCLKEIANCAIRLRFIVCSTRVRQKITCTVSSTTFEELNPKFCILEMEGGGLPIPLYPKPALET